MRAYFELLFRFLLFCPAGLLASADLDTALRLAVACVGASDLERESARAVLVFLGQLAGRCGGQLDQYKGEVEAALAPHGEALTRLMFTALAVSVMRKGRLVDCSADKGIMSCNGMACEHFDSSITASTASTPRGKFHVNAHSNKAKAHAVA